MSTDIALALASPIPPFQPNSDPSTTAQRWKKWTQRVDNFFIAVNIDDATSKKAMFLHLAGESVQDTFDGLVVDDAPDHATDDNNVYTIARQALDNFFSPKKNVTFEIYNFRLARQNVGETIDAYTARLRTLAKFCEFPNIDSELKSHIIQTCLSTRLRRFALSEPNWSLKELLDKARSMEAAERQVKTIETGANGASNSAPSVAAVRGGHAKQPRRQPPPPPSSSSSRQPYNGNTRPSSSGQTCRNCGGPYPHAGGRESCPAFGKSCSFCSKLNHFAKVCRGRQAAHRPPSTRVPPKQQVNRRCVRQIQQDQEHDDRQLHRQLLCRRRRKRPG